MSPSKLELRWQVVRLLDLSMVPTIRIKGSSFLRPRKKSAPAVTISGPFATLLSAERWISARADRLGLEVRELVLPMGN